MSNDKRKYIRNYFDLKEFDIPTLRNVAKFGSFLLIIGIILLYLEQINIIGDFKVIAIILILAGLFSIWILIKPILIKANLFTSKAADGDMDIWFSEDMHEVVKPRALDRLKINPSVIKEENIIIIPVPVYRSIQCISPEKIIRVMGEDGTFIYSVWEVQILVVTENFISYYSCFFDWIDTKIYEERTNEYFFDDIASVSNDKITMNHNFIDNQEQVIGDVTVFTLTNMSGDKLTVHTDIPSLNVPEGYSNNLEKLVQAIRILLRHRRYGEKPEIERTIESVDNSVEFEVQGLKEQEEKAFFHQQLREIYKDYNLDSYDKTV